MGMLKLIGVLLDYPQDELWEHAGELRAAAAEAPLGERRGAQLRGFVDALLAEDPLAAQDRWLSTFDRGRSMSLLLFEHVHGESRDRGQAMVDLIEIYRKGGYALDARELPDYLPLLLEYLDTRPQQEACDWLGHVVHIVGMLAARAAERSSPYACLFELLVEQAGGKVNLAPLRQRASQEPRDDTAEAMDRLWEEEAVRFGAEAPAQDCRPPSRPVAQPAGEAKP